MKKRICILVSLMIIVGKLSAQLTLDHTFSGYVYGQFPIIEDRIDYYYSLWNNTNTFYLYKSDYSLYKTITLTLPSGYSDINATILGKHLINTDDKIEFFIYATNPNVSTNNRVLAMIINEDGAIIHNLGYSYVYSCLGFHLVGDQIRLSILKYNYNDQNYQVNYQTEVYACQGNYTAAASFEDDDTTLRPYPNPTTTLVNLPYHIEKGTVSTINIYNVGGQLIESYNIGGDFERITIDVNNYAKGVYIYEYNGISNRFVVQ